MAPATPNRQVKLTTRQKAFAETYARAKIEGLDLTHEDIARAAGYSGNSRAIKVTASDLLRLPHIRAYLHQLAREHMHDGGIEVASALRRLTARAKTERVQLDAAKALGAAIGLTLPEGDAGAAGGPQLVVNLHFAGTQPTQAAADARIIQGYAEPADGDRSRHEGGGVLTLALGGPATAPAEGGAGGGGGGFRAPGPKGAGSAQVSPRKSSRVKNSRVGKSSGVKKRKVAKGRSKAKAAKVGDPRDAVE